MIYAKCQVNSLISLGELIKISNFNYKLSQFLSQYF